MINLKFFTGLSLYHEILEVRNSKQEIRKRFEEFENFISSNFFKQKIDLVAQYSRNGNNDEVILVHFEGEIKTRKLFEIGDGIQALIILLYKVFLAEPNTIIYIDEPELHLHPGMQRMFLEQLLRNNDLTKKNLTYFISTHSNHLLDLTLAEDNISIYAFSKIQNEGDESKFLIRNVNQGDNEILRSLGVNNSSVFLANCSIWVEGVSDRNLIKAFLLSYFKNKKINNLKEDIDFAFFEYAGSNRNHYNFDQEDDFEEFEKQINAFALNNRIYLIADSDNAIDGTPKFESLKKLESISNNSKFKSKVIWQIREIENILPTNVWKIILPKFIKKGVDETTFKTSLSKAIDKVDFSLFKLKYIGAFLKKIDSKVGPGLRKIWDGNDGTLSIKREFSEEVLKAVVNGELTWEDFKTEGEIVTLVEDIHKFILNK